MLISSCASISFLSTTNAKDTVFTVTCGGRKCYVIIFILKECNGGWKCLNCRITMVSDLVLSVILTSLIESLWASFFTDSGIIHNVELKYVYISYICMSVNKNLIFKSLPIMALNSHIFFLDLTWLFIYYYKL